MVHATRCSCPAPPPECSCRPRSSLQRTPACRAGSGRSTTRSSSALVAGGLRGGGGSSRPLLPLWLGHRDHVLIAFGAFPYRHGPSRTLPCPDGEGLCGVTYSVVDVNALIARQAIAVPAPCLDVLGHIGGGVSVYHRFTPATTSSRTRSAVWRADSAYDCAVLSSTSLLPATHNNKRR